MQDYNARSQKNLVNVDPRLTHIFFAVVVNHYSADNGPRICVIDGKRTPAEQAKKVAEGSSRTYHSRHLDGMAIDIAIFTPDGGYVKSGSMYRELAYFMEQEAEKINVCIEWGGVCFGKNFIDADHFQIPRGNDHGEMDNVLRCHSFYGSGTGGLR